jgi:hypothetical protein
MEVQLNTYNDLLQFIILPDVNFDVARQITQKFLTVLIVEIGTKEKLIEAVQKYIDDYGALPANHEKPIFLDWLELDVID